MVEKKNFFKNEKPVYFLLSYFFTKEMMRGQEQNALIAFSEFSSGPFFPGEFFFWDKKIRESDFLKSLSWDA